MDLKRHDKVRLKNIPDYDYIEYFNKDQEDLTPEIKRGMEGQINVILPNGKFHVEIKNDRGETVAYVVAGEEELEKIN